ncbi:MAG: DUF3892 domain-containing protein [Mycobacteriaceae bacterium]
MPRKPVARPQRAKKAAQAKKQARKLQIKKGGGVAPATFKRARRVDVTAAAGKGQVQVPGGADLVVQRFHGNGDAPATTTVTSGSGKRLRNAVVNLIFWGDRWNTNPPPNPSLPQVVNDAASILAGPYQLSVSQYGATPARLGTVFVSVPGNNPPTNYQTSDVANLITGAIEGGALPEPDEETTDVLHLVFMPPGTNAPPNLGGLHTYASYWDYDPPFDFDFGDRSHIAWVAFGNRGFISSVFSHELVEALTDPEGDGIQVNPTNANNWNEIGDVCASTGLVNGVTVQSYWSQNDQACIIPANIPLEMQITCIHKNPRNDPYHPIRQVGGINHTQNTNFRMTQLQCIQSIDRGNHFFVVDANGDRADVRVHIHFPPWSLQGTRYIATNPDNTRADNLLYLPEC